MNPKEILKITINLVVIYLVGGLLLAFVYSKASPVIFQKAKEEKAIALNRMMPVHLLINTTGLDKEKIKAALPADTTFAQDGVYLDALVTDGTKVKAYKKALKKKAKARDVSETSDNKPVLKGAWEIHHKHPEYYEVTRDDARVGYIVETYGKGYSSYIQLLVAVDLDMKVKRINVLHHAETPGLGDEILLDWFKDMYIDKDMEHLVVIKGETDDKIQAITGATISARAVTAGVRDGLELLVRKFIEGEPDAAHGEEDKKNEH